MIFSSGAISGYDSRGRYDGSQRTKIEGVSRIAAVSAVSETRRLMDERFRNTPKCAPKGDFRELFEQDENMLEQAGEYLLSVEDIKLSVLKQVIKRMQQMKEPWKGKEPSSTVLRTQWTKTAVDSVFLKDACCIAYETNGFALYSSGKNMLFDICIEMTDAFCNQYENYTYQTNMITEPVVVRIDERINDIPNVRCLFDLDDTQGNTDFFNKLKVMMQDVNGYHIRVDLQEGNAGTLFQRSVMDSQGYLHKNMCLGRNVSSEVYEQNEDSFNIQKNSVNITV